MLDHADRSVGPGRSGRGVGSIGGVQDEVTPDVSTEPVDAHGEARFGDDAELGTPAGLAVIVRIDLVLTAVFVVSAVFAAIVFNGPARVVGVVVAIALFLVGVFTFLIAYFVAVGRSREEEIGVAELYLLTGSALPAAVRRTLWLALGVQIVTALATALARPNTDGRAGSTLAFGVLVPMLGLGLNGLASARHGAFGPRRRRGDAADVDAPDSSDGRAASGELD